MRKRVHKVANFLAFNLLFFALYLNFIYKDPSSAPSPVRTQQEPAAFSGSLTDSKTTSEQPVIENPATNVATQPAKTSH